MDFLNGKGVGVEGLPLFGGGSAQNLYAETERTRGRDHQKQSKTKKNKKSSLTIIKIKNTTKKKKTHKPKNVLIHSALVPKPRRNL